MFIIFRAEARIDFDLRWLVWKGCVALLKQFFPIIKIFKSIQFFNSNKTRDYFEMLFTYALEEVVHYVNDVVFGSMEMFENIVVKKLIL